MNGMGRDIAAVWILAGSAAASGCSGGGGAETSPALAEQPAGFAQSAVADPVERSRLREAAIGVLLALSASEDPQVRANAVEGLLPAPARLDAVLPAALADPNVGVRTVAAMVIGRGKIEGFVPAVRPLLADDSPYVRAAAIYALRALGEPADPTPLGSMVTGDPSSRVRAHAAFILGELGDPGTSSLLRDAATEDVARATPVELKVLQVQIAEALVKLGDAEQLHTVRAALYPSTPEELDATVLAVQVLGTQRDRASEGQLRNLALMRDPSGAPMPVEVRLAVAGALGAMGITEFEGAALEALELGGEPQQIQAAWALGEIASPNAVGVLEERLGSGSERVRVAVASALLRALEHRPGV